MINVNGALRSNVSAHVSLQSSVKSVRNAKTTLKKMKILVFLIQNLQNSISSLKMDQNAYWKPQDITNIETAGIREPHCIFFTDLSALEQKII